MTETEWHFFSGTIFGLFIGIYLLGMLIGIYLLRMLIGIYLLGMLIGFYLSGMFITLIKLSINDQSGHKPGKYGKTETWEIVKISART